MSKGYTCMIHIHTFSDEITVKDLIWGIEKDPKSDDMVKKEKPKFVKSGAKLFCTITSTRPIPLEKVNEMASLGRFTLRDEGKTIAVGRVIKYKPFKEIPKPAAGSDDVAKKLAGTKIGESMTEGQPAFAKPSVAGDIVFNLDTGEAEEKKDLQAIAEDDDAAADDDGDV